MDYSPPGSSAHGILQARILEWLAIPFSRGSSQPRGRIQVSSNCRQILYRLSHQGSPATVESQWTSFWHVWGCVFGSQEIHQWIYTHIYMYTHIYTHSLSRSQGEQMFLPAFFFLLWYQLNCLFISSSLLLLFCQFLLSWLLFGLWGKLLTLRLLEILSLSVLSQSCLPNTYPLQTMVHDPSGVG